MMSDMTRFSAGPMSSGAANTFDPPGKRPQHRQLLLCFVQEALALAVVQRIDLARDHQHGAGGEARLEQARHAVGGAGSGTGDRHAKLARGPGVAIGRMQRALFVTDADRA